MLTAEQLRDRIAQCAAGSVPLDEFEDWFSARSRNVHLWGDDDLKRFVFDVESVFSRYYFENLPEADVRLQLEQEAERFAHPFAASRDLVVLWEPAKHPARAVTALAAVVFAVAPSSRSSLPTAEETQIFYVGAADGIASSSTTSATGAPVRLEYAEV